MVFLFCEDCANPCQARSRAAILVRVPLRALDRAYSDFPRRVRSQRRPLGVQTKPSHTSSASAASGRHQALAFLYLKTFVGRPQLSERKSAEGPICAYYPGERLSRSVRWFSKARMPTNGSRGPRTGHTGGTTRSGEMPRETVPSGEGGGGNVPGNETLSGCGRRFRERVR